MIFLPCSSSIESKIISSELNGKFFLNIERRNAEVISNHPVHLLDENGNLSQSAFIPFCAFGGDFSIMGEKIDEFDVAVCNSFRPKIVQNQLCYEVDLNKFQNFSNIEIQLKKGFTFLYDINEDKARFRNLFKSTTSL